MNHSTPNLKNFFGDKDPFANFDEFFEDVDIEEIFEGSQGGKKSLQSMLQVFYKSIGKYAEKKVSSLVEKYAGKETKLEVRLETAAESSYFTDLILDKRRNEEFLNLKNASKKERKSRNLGPTHYT